jgi:hypothetical protein
MASESPPDSVGQSHAGGLLDSEAVRALGNALNSPQFINSPRAGRFLRYIVEAALSGSESGLKEYVLGIEVFDRSGKSFDPRIDTIVRVEAVKLRKRLREYYRGPGRSDPIIIEMPPGAYRPVFRTKAPRKIVRGVPSRPCLW